MEHLPQVQNSSPAKRTLSALSPGLKGLLCDEPNNDRAIGAIATNPLSLNEAKAALAALEREAESPAGPVGVFRVVGRRFAIYPQPERSDDEQEAWWDSYYDVLADIPEATLDAAMIAWARTAAEFLPKPGQILALTEDHPGKEKLAVLRIRAAMRWTPPPEPVHYPERQPFPAPELRKVTGADRQSIRQMARDFADQLPERKKPEIRSNPARVDPVTGVSPELRELVDNQRARAEARGE